MPGSSASGDWSVTFEPINDLLGANVAYVISYAKAPYLADLRHDFLLTLAFATLTLGWAFLAHLAATDLACHPAPGKTTSADHHRHDPVLQGASLLTHTFRQPDLIARETARLKEWVNAL